LVEIGAENHARLIPELKAADHYEHPGSAGYDAQSYAQIAMHPRLADPALRAAVDDLSYRARRPLFEWTAWVLGGGDPERALNVFAFQNVACWLILALVLLRWLPPVSWGNVLRWACVLFSFGLIFSVRRALLDGPSLLLVAGSMALIESGRPWPGAVLMGIGGLGKETSLLCATAFGPPASSRARDWAPWLGRISLVVLPLVAWALCLRMWVGAGGAPGLNNFSGIFEGLCDKVVGTVSSLAAQGFSLASDAGLDALVLAGLLAQFAFFAFRIRWREAWWRVGASYAVLMAFLGDAVWEDHPSAAARVLLPMTLAFNVLVPRGAWWPVLLVAGNLGVVGSADLLRPPSRVAQGYVVEGPRELRLNPADGTEVEASYGARNWWWPEGEGRDYWRWSRGECSVVIRNPQPFPVVADIDFHLATVDARGATVTIGGRVAWRGALKPATDNRAAVPGVVLPPGGTVLVFGSDHPAVPAGPGDRRLLMYSVRDLRIVLRGRP
jgi:hypothetical protein